MYYARELFVKKGPLATLWLAGSVMRKVGKHQVVHADITKMCDLVENPDTPFALPTQSILLRGVVRIENKKAAYLLEDAEGATGRLTEPTTRVREHTTLAPNKIKARHETITYTDEDQARLSEEGFQTMAQLDDISLMVDSTGGELLFGDVEMKVRDIEEAAVQGRMEDITLTQDLSQIGLEEPLDFGALDADVEFGDGFGEAALDMDAALGAGAPSPALSAIEAAASGLPGLDLDAIAAPVRRKKGRKARAYVPVIDDHVEVDDRTLREWLADPSDVVIERPVMEPRVRARIPLDDFLLLPPAANPIDFLSVNEGLVESFKRACKNKVVVDEAGHTPAEIEMEMGGDAGWDVDEGYAAEEARAEEYESMVTGGDMEDLSRSIHMAEAGDQGEGMLFGLTEEQVSGEVRRTRRDVSGRFEVVTDMETPDFEVPESQFEVPKEEQAARQKAMRATIERRAVNKHTEIFRHEVEKKFAALAKARQPQIVALDDLLREILHGDPNRRDRSLAFFQVLVLASLDVIGVDQAAEFADVHITKGRKWGVRFSESQMFSESEGRSQ